MPWPEMYRPGDKHSETEVTLAGEAHDVIRQYVGLRETLSAWMGPGKPDSTLLSEKQVIEIMASDNNAEQAIRNILAGRWQHKGPYTDEVRERLAWGLVAKLRT